MRVKDLVKKFNLPIAAGKNGLEREVKSGYCGDLLSEVIANAPEGCAWMTVQGHQNIVAVAVLRRHRETSNRIIKESSVAEKF
jgi:hypothetical protein